MLLSLCSSQPITKRGSGCSFEYLALYKCTARMMHKHLKADRQTILVCGTMAATRRPARRRTQYRTLTRRRKPKGRTLKSRRRTVRHMKIRQKKRPTRIRAKIAGIRTYKKIRMTKNAWGMLHSYVDKIYRRVSDEAERLRKKERRDSIVTSDVQSALKQVMPRNWNRRVASGKIR